MSGAGEELPVTLFVRCLGEGGDGAVPRLRVLSTERS